MRSNMLLTFRDELPGPDWQFNLGEYEGWIACQIYLWCNRQQQIESQKNCEAKKKKNEIPFQPDIYNCGLFISWFFSLLRKHI